MNKIIGMYLFDESVEAEAFCRDLVTWRVDHAILNPAFFSSASLEADASMETGLRKHGLKLWLNLPIFQNPKHLEAFPEDYSITGRGEKAIHDWCHFVCPRREGFLDTLRKEYSILLKRLQPEVVSLDFIRYFVFWELVDLSGSAASIEASASIEAGCYCPVCLEAFEKEIGERVDRDAPAATIAERFAAEWGAWKAKRILEVATSFVDLIRETSPASPVGLKTVPWKQSDLGGALFSTVGQDLPRLAELADYVSPMAFTHVLRKDLRWKRELLAETSELTRKPVTSFLQIDKLYRDEALSNEEFEAELEFSLSDAYCGFPIFTYEQAAASKEKARLLQRRLEAARPF